MNFFCPFNSGIALVNIKRVNTKHKCKKLTSFILFSIRIWDIRVTPSKSCMITASDAHESDINVISWNRNEPFIVSGGDDAVLKIWDLRHFKVSF